MTIIASGTVSRIDCRWTSRETASRRVRRSNSPNHAIATPSPANTAARTSPAANEGESECARLGKFPGRVKVKHEAESGGDEAGPDPSQHAGDEDGRRQKQVERLVVEYRGKQRPQHECNDDERQRHRVDRRFRRQCGANHGAPFRTAIDQVEVH